MLPSFTPHRSRRQFLALSAAASLTAALHPLAGRAATGSKAVGKKKVPIGIELYAVRGELSKDLPNTLRRVAQMGYECVEFYSPYLQWTFPYAKQVRTMLDDLGLRCYSTHNSAAAALLDAGTMEKAIELNQILGTRHIIAASPPRGVQGIEAWKRICEQFSAASEKLSHHGLAAGYHNHATEWEAFTPGGPRVMDIIAQNTPAEFVLQLDVGTALKAGIDTVAWIKSKPGRIRSVHLKDWGPPKEGDETGYRVLFGEGIAPWKQIIAAAESVGGVEYYLMEQEGSRYSEFETAERCLATWRKIRAQV